MTNLIDADELSELVGEPIEVFFSRLDLKLPQIIDAEPIRHGKWIDMGDYWKCSECTATQLKKIPTVYGDITWEESKYCPCCGAKMKKDNERSNQ